MKNKKPHLSFSGFANPEKFKSKRLGRPQGIPPRNRIQHGNKLLNEYNQILQLYLSKQPQAPISPNKKEITNADTVSLLTTSGRADGHVFETTHDSSPATAIVSNSRGSAMGSIPRFLARNN